MSKFIAPDGREYPITLAEVTNKEAKLLSEVSGVPYYKLVSDLALSNPDGMTAFYWLAMRKNDRHVEYDGLEFPMGKVKFVLDEPDPTKGPAETPKAGSTSSRSTRSTKSAGKATTPK